jgi:hypothetical protein
MKTDIINPERRKILQVSLAHGTQTDNQDGRSAVSFGCHPALSA